MPEEPSSDDPKINNPTPENPPAPAPPSENDKMLQAVAEVEKESSPIPAPENSEPALPVNNSFQPNPTQPKSKKKLIFIIAAIILLVFAGSGTAYALWFNHPDTVTADAVKNLVAAKTMINEGKYTFKDTKSKSSVDLTFKSQSDAPKYAGSLDVGAKITYQGLSVDVNGAGMMSESGTIYFKLDNVSELTNKALETDYGMLYVRTPQLQDAIKKFATKIDNKWIRLDKTDLAFYSENFEKERSCYKKALSTFYDNQTQQDQVVNVYKANRFFIVKDTGKSQTINGQDSVGYSVTYSARKADQFDVALKETTIGKALQNCTNNGKKSSSELDPSVGQEDQQKEADKLKTTLWISRWSHQLTKVETSSNDKNTTNVFDATLKPNANVQLKDPKDFIKAQELQTDLEDLFAQISQEALGTSEPMASQN